MRAKLFHRYRIVKSPGVIRVEVKTDDIVEGERFTSDGMDRVLAEKRDEVGEFECNAAVGRADRDAPGLEGKCTAVVGDRMERGGGGGGMRGFTGRGRVGAVDARVFGGGEKGTVGFAVTHCESSGSMLANGEYL